MAVASYHLKDAMAKISTRKKITVYMDGPLVEVAKSFVAVTPREKSVSQLLDKLLEKYLRDRSGAMRKAKLRLPAHLVAE